jgi:hypothetical protein
MMGKHDHLHRLHDGELSDEERRTVEGALDDDGRARLAALGDLGALLRHSFAAESEGVDVAAAVMATVSQPRPSLWRRLLNAVRSYRMVWIPGLVAAAAVAVFYLSPWRGAVTNECEIESLEVTGASATVLKLPDSGSDGTSTVIWIDEEEEEEAR